MPKKKNNKSLTGLFFISGIAFISLLIFAYFSAPLFIPVTYDASGLTLEVLNNKSTIDPLENEEDIFVATHVATPNAVKAIYMTACVAGTPSFRSDLVRIVEDTEVNSLIIDIKDYSGGISFKIEDPQFTSAIGVNCYARDMLEFIASLHEKNIYVIGRITVFQDPHYAKLRPDLAVKKESDKTIVWADYKGINFIDVGAEEYWKYIVDLSKESYALGFDEINFDYIRFPSDGNMRDIYYPFSEEELIKDPSYGKAKVVREFFRYLHKELQDTDVVLSADLFGMVTTNSDDLNIGQVMEFALPYFDYIAPMVYPSHYPKYFNGYANPNHYVYEVVQFSMTKAVERLQATTTRVKELGDVPIASTTPQLYTKQVFDKLKLRPWLQDFDYGGDYDVEEVRKQIQATYDSGLTSWMLWAPSNRYTEGALEPAELLEI